MNRGLNKRNGFLKLRGHVHFYISACGIAGFPLFGTCFHMLDRRGFSPLCEYYDDVPVD